MFGTWRVCPKSNKGSRDRQFIRLFTRGGITVRIGKAPRVGTAKSYDEMETDSGTSVSNQGGVSSDMPWKRLAVLLAGRPSNKAPR